MSSNNCFHKITENVFPPWQCVNAHLNAADQQTAKTIMQRCSLLPEVLIN